MSNAAFSSIINHAIQVITNPVGFYRQMEKNGGYAAPIIFVIVMAIIAGLMVAILSLFGANMSAGMAIGLMAIVMIPIMALIGSFIGAAILFVIWKLLGSEASFETAYRCVAYSTAIIPITSLLGLVPYFGSIIKLAWSTYLIYVASVEVHNLKAGTAMAVFGVLGSLMLLITLSGERAARSLSSQFDGLDSQLGNLGKQLEKKGEILPEEARKALAGALLGSSDDQVENEKSPPESPAGNPNAKIESQSKQLETEDEQLSEEKQRALAESLAGGFNDQLENLGKQLENEGDLSPGEAGKALGEFLKGLEKATQQEQ